MVSRYKSWFPDREYSAPTEKYFKMIEKVFKIQLGDNSWDHIVLTPHQRDYHANDIVIKGSKALYDIVIKSRNTSFTINSIIRLCTGNYRYRDEIVPLSRINERKVKELIDEAKKLIQHMTPIQLKICPDCKKLKPSCRCLSGNVVTDYWPFNPKLCKFNALSIEFPDRKVMWNGYAGLSPDAAEIIRGVRTTRGLIDESNYMRYFELVYTAMRDSSRGAVLKDGEFDENNVHHQISVGTTLKGYTKFFYWLEDIRKKVGDKLLDNIRILEWPVFRKDLFDPENPFENWEQLVTIVPWHTKPSMKNKIIENLYTFLEEYMAVVTPDETQLYNIAELQDTSNSKAWATGQSILYQEFPPGDYRLGVDPAGEGGHFFAIALWYQAPEEDVFHQIYLNQEQRSDLTEREQFIDSLIDVVPLTRARIDGNGLAYQMSQNLQKKYPGIVEVFRGSVNARTVGKQTISINEYIHTNQILGIKTKTFDFIDEELQAKQYAGWNRKYKAEESPEIGHCDSTVANGLALLPINWKVAGRENGIKVSQEKQIPDSTLNETKSEVEKFHNETNLKDRIKYYKKRR